MVGATRRILELLNKLKMSATQDASLRGRIIVGQGVGVNKVEGVDAHSFTIQVIDSFDSLPAAIQQDATYQDDKGNTQNYEVSGVWHDGTLYVVADTVQGNSDSQLTTFDAYEELLAHEIIGHFGVQQVFGQEYKTKLQQLFNALGGLDGIRKIAKDNGVDMQQFESAYIQPRTQAAKDGIYTEADVQQSLVGELFAFVAQNQINRPIAVRKFKELVGYIRQWFRDRGFDKLLSRYNDTDLMMFLAEARKAVVDRSYFGKYKNQESSPKNDSDTPLYSRGQSAIRTNTTAKQVRDVLVSRFGEATISKLEKASKLNILDTYSKSGIEGFYQNGKVTLIADALTGDTIIPTFLHELGGHAGFQNMMSSKQYNELMNQFNKLVVQNNPIALEAKALAERETNRETQKLEYLPYLLTLASNAKNKNAIHKGNVKRLIDDLISKVKAWIYDNWGINLSLNTDDMVALAERMIDKAANDSKPIASQDSNRQESIADISKKLKDFIQKVRENRGQKQTIDILPASNTLAYEAKQHGLNIDGFTHHIDYSAVNHVDANHSNAKVEQNRGNLAITDADYVAIPQVIENPDYVVYGTKNKIGRDMIVYLKQLDDGSLLYLEEIRTGKEKLALQSMRKYPPTTNATSILKSLRPTSKTASVDDISIVDRRENNQPLYSRNADYNAIADRITNGVKNNHFCA